MGQSAAEDRLIRIGRLLTDGKCMIQVANILPEATWAALLRPSAVCTMLHSMRQLAGSLFWGSMT